MKLKRLFIENYGNLSGKEFLFGDGLNEIEGGNGYGKTTVASFIRAMFYGLPSSRSNAKEFDDRQHFYPFGGGNFGGSAVFEFQGKEYRIERFFDKKSDTKDECRIYCDGAPVDIGADAGRYFFGLDADSFARTLFIRCDGGEISSTAGINAKLNNFVGDTDDDNNFDTAMERLAKKQKEYKNSKNSGLIPALTERIKAEEWEIKNIREIENGLQAQYRTRNALKAEIIALSKEAEREREGRVVAEKWKRYDKLLSDAGECEAERLSTEGNLPGERALAELEAAVNGVAEASALLSALSFGGREEELEGLKKRFQSGIPDGQRLKAVSDNIAEAASLSADGGEEIDAGLSNFAGGVPADEKVNEMRAKAERLSALKNFVGSLPPVTEAPKSKPKHTKALISLIAGALLCAAGIGLLFVNLIAGIICLVSGILVCGAGGFMYLKDNLSRSLIAGGAEPSPFAEQAEALEREICAFIAAYGYGAENGALYGFACFESGLSEHKRRLSSVAAQEERREKNRSRLNELKVSLKDFFAQYGETGEDFNGAYMRLNADISRLNSLERDYKEYLSRRAEAEEKLALCRQNCERVFAEYPCPGYEDFSERLKQFTRRAARAAELKEREKKLKAEAEEYAAANALSVRPEESAESGIEGKLKEKESQLLRLDNEISAVGLTVEQLPDKLSQLEADRERLEGYRKKYGLLGETAKCLGAAEAALRNKYVAPIKGRFRYYSDKLERALGERIVMDKNYRVSFESGGAVRDDRHLSSGQRDICSLCLRLALIDNMYKNDVPFVVLDDPFVNLDGEHIKKAAAVLKELSADRQMIYLICHPSRSART